VFTGLIETVGVVREVRPGAKATTLAIESDLPVDRMNDGESVAVLGVCLTVTHRAGRRFRAEAIPETLRRTTLGGLRVGARVNLERALKVGDRLGGHLVQGHVDGTVAVREVIRSGGEWRVRLERSEELRRYIAYKGSVALDGVSLTVAAVTADRFDVALIPETLERTTLRDWKAGSLVNVEVDLLARYLETLTGDRPGSAPGTTGGERA
jgi:riboflavin synthase